MSFPCGETFRFGRKGQDAAALHRTHAHFCTILREIQRVADGLFGSFALSGLTESSGKTRAKGLKSD